MSDFHEEQTCCKPTKQGTVQLRVCREIPKTDASNWCCCPRLQIALENGGAAWCHFTAPELPERGRGHNSPARKKNGSCFSNFNADGKQFRARPKISVPRRNGLVKHTKSSPGLARQRLLGCCWSHLFQGAGVPPGPPAGRAGRGRAGRAACGSFGSHT